MKIDHKCLECGFTGESDVAEGKVRCPICGTVNDVWLASDTPPDRHKEANDEAKD